MTLPMGCYSKEQQSSSVFTCMQIAQVNIWIKASIKTMVPKILKCVTCKWIHLIQRILFSLYQRPGFHLLHSWYHESFKYEIVVVKELLRSHFLLKNFEQAKYFLGLKLSQSTKGIYLSQMKYCLQIIEDFGFLAAKPSPLSNDAQLAFVCYIGQSSKR